MKRNSPTPERETGAADRQIRPAGRGQTKGASLGACLRLAAAFLVFSLLLLAIPPPAQAASTATAGLTGTGVTVQAGNHQPGASYNQGFGGYTSTGSFAGTTSASNQSGWQLIGPHESSDGKGTSWASSSATSISANLVSNTAQSQDGYLINNLVLDTTKSFAMTMDYTMTGNPYNPGALLGIGATYEAYGSGIGLVIMPAGDKPRDIEYQNSAAGGNTGRGIDSVVWGNPGSVYAGLDFYRDTNDPSGLSVSQTAAAAKILQVTSNGALPATSGSGYTYTNGVNYTSGTSTGQTTSLWQGVSVSWTPSSGSTGTLTMTVSGHTLSLSGITLPAAATFGYAASHSSTAYYYTQGTVTPQTFSGTSAVQSVTVNYLNSSNGQHILTSDTIRADSGSLIGIIPSGSTPNAADTYDFSAPTIPGYTLSSVAASGGIGMTRATSATLQVNYPNSGNSGTTSVANAFTLTYSPNPQTATFTYSWAASTPGQNSNPGQTVGNVSLPANHAETGAVGGTIPDQTSTQGVSLPAWNAGNGQNWLLTNPLSPLAGSVLSGSSAPTPYEVSVAAPDGKTYVQTGAGTTAAFDSSGAQSAGPSLNGNILQTVQALPANATYSASNGNTFTTTLIPNQTDITWKINDPSGVVPAYSESLHSVSGTYALAGSPLVTPANSAADFINRLLADGQVPDGWSIDGYTYSADGLTPTTYPTYAALLAAHPTVENSNPVVSLDLIRYSLPKAGSTGAWPFPLLSVLPGLALALVCSTVKKEKGKRNGSSYS